MINELLLDHIADSLADPGYVIIDNAIPDLWIKDLLDRLTILDAMGMKPAGIGRGDDYQHNLQVRGDQIHWLSGDDTIEKTFLDWMDELRQGLNQRLYLGLVDYESHFAVYPAGSHYEKHLDSFKESMKNGLKPQRKISTVFYLNPNWVASDLGQLVLYDESGSVMLEEVAPECGRLVVFISDRFPHEVKPARQKRHSIAGWFRLGGLKQ